MHTQMSVSSAAMSAELTALMTSRSTQKTNMHPYLPLSPHTRIEGFLVDIATCFYSRVTQIWALREPVPVPIPVPLGPLILPEDDRDDGDDGPLGVIAPPRPGSSVVQLTHIEDMWEDDSDKESDSGAADADADVIDPLAYRIPCPRSSGGMQCVYLQCYVLCAVYCVLCDVRSIGPLCGHNYSNCYRNTSTISLTRKMVAAVVSHLIVLVIIIVIITVECRWC